jgi:hypothetical protein
MLRKGPIRSGFITSSILYVMSMTFLAAQTPLARITVHAGNHPRVQTPVRMALEHGILEPHGNYILRSIGGGQDIPCQVHPADDRVLIFVLMDSLLPGQEQSFNLVRLNEAPPIHVRAERDEKTLTLHHGDHPVLQYHHATMPSPAGIDTVFKRSGFIHPLWSPDGHVLTRIQPPDHYHHYGIWNPWTKTRFEGRTIDFWNLAKNEGTVAHAIFLWQASGPVYGAFQARLDHIDKTAPGGPKVALLEERHVGVWHIPFEDAPAWLIDFTSELRCASQSGIILEQYRYAGFGFRARESWTRWNSAIQTSEGHDRSTADGTRGRWCMVYGETGTGVSGILFMGHPLNRDFPEPMRIWPDEENRGRGDVFFNFCPVKQNDWPLEPGFTYVLRYRMLVHEGILSEETAERLWNDFAFPPKTEIQYLITD